MKYNIITHITTLCNYDCTYCDVVKDKKFLVDSQRENILTFIKENHECINRFKFFGWEPLLAFKDIRYIVDNAQEYIWDNFEIVTNTTLINDEVWEYLRDYFSHIFFSIDSENTFDYEKVISFIQKYGLEKKLYFNLIISPGKEEVALEQFYKLLEHGMKGFNILPVYFTQPWTKENLSSLWKVMKEILDIYLTDISLRLYGFQENQWYDTSLANNTLFIDIDGKIYFSDMASTFSWKTIKEHLHLWSVEDFDISTLEWYTFGKEKKYIIILEEALYKKTPWQKELHKMMDYFSVYLNTKK